MLVTLDIIRKSDCLNIYNLHEIRKKLRQRKAETTYVATEEHRANLSTARKGFVFSKEQLANQIRGAKMKHIEIIFQDGKKQVFDSNRQAGESIGCTYSVISRMASEKYPLPENIVSIQRVD